MRQPGLSHLSQSAMRARESRKRSILKRRKTCVSAQYHRPRPVAMSMLIPNLKWSPLINTWSKALAQGRSNNDVSSRMKSCDAHVAVNDQQNVLDRRLPLRQFKDTLNRSRRIIDRRTHRWRTSNASAPGCLWAMVAVGTTMGDCVPGFAMIAMCNEAATRNR
eukprot:s2523_g3.t1